MFSTELAFPGTRVTTQCRDLQQNSVGSRISLSCNFLWRGIPLLPIWRRMLQTTKFFLPKAMLFFSQFLWLALLLHHLSDRLYHITPGVCHQHHLAWIHLFVQTTIPINKTPCESAPQLRHTSLQQLLMGPLVTRWASYIPRLRGIRWMARLLGTLIIPKFRCTREVKIPRTRMTGTRVISQFLAAFVGDGRQG